MSYGDVDLEVAAKKAFLEKTMHKDLLDEMEYKIDCQESYIESDDEPDWNEGDLSYGLAFDDIWNESLWNDENAMLKKIKDWLIEIGYYISHPHPKWVYFTKMGSNPQIQGTEFRYKNKVWQTLQHRRFE